LFDRLFAIFLSARIAISAFVFRGLTLLLLFLFCNSYIFLYLYIYIFMHTTRLRLLFPRCTLFCACLFAAITCLFSPSASVGFDPLPCFGSSWIKTPSVPFVFYYRCGGLSWLETPSLPFFFWRLVLDSNPILVMLFLVALTMDMFAPTDGVFFLLFAICVYFARSVFCLVTALSLLQLLSSQHCLWVENLALVFGVYSFPFPKYIVLWLLFVPKASIWLG